MSKIFISCALPYANGPCHLGHIRSTYLPADIYARYNRMIGNDVLMVCATDEHGTPIAVKADKENKKAHYTCAIVLVYPDGKTISAEGYLHGEITENRAGTNGFGYDPIFVPEGYDKTFAQLSSEIKNTISHRARAMEKFLSYFNNK